MASLLPENPPDNTGSETLDRYRYQAQVAVRYCLECVSNGNQGVYVEHFEDIAVEYSDKWRFFQVKSRENHLPRWTLVSAMDGLGSLHRTFAVVRSVNCDFCLLLEGQISPNNLLSNLTSPSRNISDELVTEVCKGLKIGDDDCRGFLERVTVIADQPPKAHITNYNIKLLSELSSNTPHNQLEAVETSLTDEILKSMAATRIGKDLLKHVCGTETMDVSSEVVKLKMLDRERVKTIVGSISSGPHPLLKRINDTSLPVPSKLETKMIGGGAKQSIITKAKELRANTTIRITELQASSMFGIDEKLEDAEMRHEQWAEAIIAKHEHKTSPANEIWSDMSQQLVSSSDIQRSLDPNNLFRDPYLILGNICDLSDQCKFGWGGEDA